MRKNLPLCILLSLSLFGCLPASKLKKNSEQNAGGEFLDDTAGGTTSGDGISLPATPGGSTGESGAVPSPPVTQPIQPVLETNARDGLMTIPLAKGTATDWLTQNVCVDQNGNAIEGDPATCGASRDLHIGEDVFYLHRDSKGGMSNTSVPLLLGNAPRIVAAFNRVPVRDFALSHGDIYDIYEADGNLTSATGTRNATTSQDNFMFWGKQEGGATWAWLDGWVFFPICAINQNCPVNVHGSNNSGTYAISDGTDTVRDNHISYTYTLWNKRDYIYPNNKKLNVIISHHTNAANAEDLINKANNETLAIEVYHFSKEYGLTRYENWLSTQECLRQHPIERLPGKTICYVGNTNTSCKDANATQGFSTNGRWVVRAGCEDFSNYEKLTVPISPYSLPVGRAHLTSRNLLKNTDFGENNTLNWNRIGAMNWKLYSEEIEANNYLNFSCSANPCPAGESLFQDVPTAAITESYFPYSNISLQNGALLKASADGAEVLIKVFFLSPTGAILDSIYKKVSLTKDWTPIRFHREYSSHDIGKTIRFQIYPLTGGVVYSVDEVFMAPLPYTPERID